MGSQVFDHGRVVPGALVAELALKRLLTCMENRKCQDFARHVKRFCTLNGAADIHEQTGILIHMESRNMIK